MILKKIYRRSDSRGGQTKIDGISKYQCFSNFIDLFGCDGITIVADNVRPETEKLLASQVQDVHRTALVIRRALYMPWI